MRLDPIIAALRRRCPSFENRFAGAAEWAGLTEDEAPALPAAYVVPLAEDAGGNESQVGYQQTVTNTFAVIVLVSNVCDERGQKAFDSLEDLRLELFRAILSWLLLPSTARLSTRAGRCFTWTMPGWLSSLSSHSRPISISAIRGREWTSMSSDLSRAQTSGLTVLNRRPRRISRTTKLKQL